MSRPAAEPVPISDEMIRLGQLLKLAGLVEDGASARLLLADDAVQVNGQVETRRGRQLVAGDEIEVDLPTGVRRLQITA
ncbi:RNA-binding S4 domain-containing protein [Ruania rhizosphaerae]|uniref:RNA-binding S4 domain-containing protein n=1 Tax=Ruania rhizosphaerae TaxID=1840413 RepID=UPI001358BC86|nr:RNA-binding S4 domain-containing protein [Ruania rhizosphaerae]